MNDRGIIYNIWWDNDDIPDFIDELNFSIHCSKKTNYPIKVLIDEEANIKIDSINIEKENLIFYSLDDKEKKYNHWIRKLKLIDFSPFEESLFLDTDAFILDSHKCYHDVNQYPLKQNFNHTIDYVFSKLESYGMAIAFDGHVMGQREYRFEIDGRKEFDVCHDYLNLVIKYLGKKSCPSLFNWGVVFFNKSNETKDLFSLAKEILMKEGCTEQFAMTIASEILKSKIFILESKVWNQREHDGHFSKFGTKILHNPHWFKAYKDYNMS